MPMANLNISYMDLNKKRINYLLVFLLGTIFISCRSNFPLNSISGVYENNDGAYRYFNEIVMGLPIKLSNRQQKLIVYDENKYIILLKEDSTGYVVGSYGELQKAGKRKFILNSYLNNYAEAQDSSYMRNNGEKGLFDIVYLVDPIEDESKELALYFTGPMKQHYWGSGYDKFHNSFQVNDTIDDFYMIGFTEEEHPSYGKCRTYSFQLFGETHFPFLEHLYKNTLMTSIEMCNNLDSNYVLYVSHNCPLYYSNAILKINRKGNLKFINRDQKDFSLSNKRQIFRKSN